MPAIILRFKKLVRCIPRRPPDAERDSVLAMLVDVTGLVDEARRADEAASRIELAQRALGLGLWHGVAGDDGAWWDRHMFALRGVDSPPRIVRRNRYRLKPLTLEDALCELEGTAEDVLVYRDAETDRVAVVYRQRDGSLALVQPEF